MPKDHKFQTAIFLHILHAIKVIVPIVEMSHTKFSKDGNNSLEAILHRDYSSTFDMADTSERWDLKILLTRRPL